jgi:hypothetical protein
MEPIKAAPANTIPISPTKPNEGVTGLVESLEKTICETVDIVTSLYAFLQLIILNM